MRTKPQLGRRLRSLLLLIVMISVAYYALPKPALYGAKTFSHAVYDRHHELLRLTLADDQRYRLYTPIESISPDFIRATLLYEDRHFHYHPGINPAAALRAAWTTYVKRSRRVGGSTITMQLARLRFDLNTRTVPGKIVQMARALQLERHYTKTDLLEAYLNLAPYGGNIEGAGTAALIYFDKSAASLTLPEALALAVIPQNPAQRAPTRSTKLPALQEARERLLTTWIDHHPVSASEAALIRLPPEVRHPNALPFHAPHFVQRLIDTRPDARHTVSTLDLTVQHRLERILAHYLEQRRHDGIRNASALLVNTRTLEVAASIGSADFFDVAISGQVNGVEAKRSPGSTLKPFVYGLALDQGIIHPMSLMSDAPRRFGVYTPENFDRGFMGPVLARDALIYSRNVPAISLLNEVGLNTFHSFLLNADVRDLKQADHYGLAMVLGGNELTMTELVQLYAMLANEGRWQPLVATRNAHHKPRHFTQLLSPEASFLVLDMLKRNPRPDDLALPAESNRAVAWKTGTSYAFRDAWTVGVTGDWTLAVWVGNFDGSATPSLIGRKAAAPLFFALIDALQIAPSPDGHEAIPSDLNLRQVKMCASTGDLPNRYCPQTEDGWFIPGVSPIRVSNVHRPVHIDQRTGQRACYPTASTVTKIYEFWPSDLSTVFRQAGIAKRQPPTYEHACENPLNAGGTRPTITSPLASLDYSIKPQSTSSDRLVLTATADADASTLFWFIDDRFIAEVNRDDAFVWSPDASVSTGLHDVLVVDDLGRSDSHAFRLSVRH
ncbi:MAG: penicillin-binding protein 1C [Pseudomonadota bacterium]